MVKLITTDSQFNIFPLLINSLKGVNDLNAKNIIFCEEKISLMAERYICAQFGGSFSTSVYSFGNYLRTRSKFNKILSKEGASMAVKSILLDCSLKRLSKSRQNLASSVYDLIIQLKSASVTPNELKDAGNIASGILKDKLLDLSEVYAKYEQFLDNSGYVDQSGMLNELPGLIENSNDFDDANVFIIGYASFTAQIRKTILALLRKANNVTAILTEGQNAFSFVNETANVFRALSRSAGYKLEQEFIKSDYSLEGEKIKDYLFNPSAYLIEKQETKNVKLLKAKNGYEEIERVASIIRQKVMSGECRYKDITLALPNVEDYKEKIRDCFNALQVPYFLDDKKGAISHPLVKLILSYIDAFRKNFEKDALKNFYSNPYFNLDKSLSDDFYNYVLRYGINYSSVKKKFTLATKTDRKLEDLEAFRQKIVGFLEKFDVYGLLEKLQVKEKCVALAKNLNDLDEDIESAISMQIYSAVINVLNEINKILPSAKDDLLEFRSVFLSGAEAIEISIIPQYNDAVFIGGYREVSLAKAKYLFCVGLTFDVPSYQEDGALLSDADIDDLERLKVLVEPKIKIVNHRTKENLTLALSAFDKGLYLSYPILTDKNTENKESDVITTIKGQLFNVIEAERVDGFMSLNQGIKTFATKCGEFAEGALIDFEDASSFYLSQADGKSKEVLESLLKIAQKEVKFRLEKNSRALLQNVKSPTSIEEYNLCPYRAFLSKSLKITEREEGGVSALSIGNFMHEIFEKFVGRVDEVKDRESSKVLFEQIKEGVLSKPDFSGMTEGAENNEITLNVSAECEKFCYKTYEWLSSGEFKAEKGNLEVKFGDLNKGATYPPLKLFGGTIELTGKVDRIDTTDEYFRIIDYKTGKASFEDKEFFVGKKLQLFLYAGVMQDKRLAGAYYLPISDGYKKEGAEVKTLTIGKSDGDEKVLNLQDKNFLQNKKSEFIPVKYNYQNKLVGVTDSSTLQDYVTYAKMVSERAIQNMSDGVIVASPYENECKYCKFVGMCENSSRVYRTVKQVKEKTISDAVRLTKEGEQNV